MLLRGSSGKTYLVNNNHFASGGEGSIHEIPGTGLVAKIYIASERTRWKREKLEGMVELSRKFKNSAIAWPLDLLFDSSGFVGFVMRKFEDTKMLSVVFTQKTYTFKDKLAIAISLCERVAEIHSVRQCIGDLSDNNIGIKGKTVYLYDADSFQFVNYTSKIKYRCCVYTKGFAAPEVLLKMKAEGTIKGMKTTPYTQEADLFVLAIHLFKLLCGSHPFSCSANATINVTLNDNIQSGYSPFFSKRRSGCDIPAYAVDPHFLPKDILQLFYKAFIIGHKSPAARPSASEWIMALKKLNAKPTKKCLKNHIFLKENKACPFCEVDRRFKRIAHHCARQPQTVNATTVNNSKKAAPNKPKIKHTIGFWLTTLALSIIIQAIIAYFMYCSPSFYNANLSEMDIFMQFIIFAAGIIGPVIHNIYSSNETFMNYISPVIISPLSSIAIVVAIYLLSIGLSLLIAFAVVAMIVGILSEL